jgi:acyl carrier protein
VGRGGHADFAGQPAAGDDITCRKTDKNTNFRADPRMTARTEPELQLARLIVETLNLEVDPASIDPEDRLYGEGLGLDSIDMLEIALAVSKSYGVELRADDENNTKIFRSLRSLAQHVQILRAA